MVDRLTNRATATKNPTSRIRNLAIVETRLGNSSVIPDNRIVREIYWGQERYLELCLALISIERVNPVLW